ncbi:MAG: hypothetical protein INQ03_15215 [Candidatus Heimdallarchaeota archaeon]|nr:hypothetical protein [Candidatus Heimdallarchaeota archaeon]
MEIKIRYKKNVVLSYFKMEYFEKINHENFIHLSKYGANIKIDEYRIFIPKKYFLIYTITEDIMFQAKYLLGINKSDLDNANSEEEIEITYSHLNVSGPVFTYSYLFQDPLPTYLREDLIIPQSTLIIYNITTQKEIYKEKVTPKESILRWVEMRIDLEKKLEQDEKAKLGRRKYVLVQEEREKALEERIEYIETIYFFWKRSTEQPKEINTIPFTPQLEQFLYRQDKNDHLYFEIKNNKLNIKQVSYKTREISDPELHFNLESVCDHEECKYTSSIFYLKFLLSQPFTAPINNEQLVDNKKIQFCKDSPYLWLSGDINGISITMQIISNFHEKKKIYDLFPNS